jgi:FkbM family methyltransferase
MYDGADTAYYLEQGHTVVAIEANPVLAKKAREEFLSEINSGSLAILNVAISEGESVELTICGQDLGSSSIHADLIASRDPGVRYRVPATTVGGIVREYGMADFIKIDIEGADRACVLSLTREIAPPYLSFEAPHDIDDLLDHLSNVGYRGFKAIQQTGFRALHRQDLLRDRVGMRIVRSLGYADRRDVRRNGRLFVRGHSAGPPPWQSDGPFFRAPQLLAQWREARAHDALRGWYDIHAAR